MCILYIYIYMRLECFEVCRRLWNGSGELKQHETPCPSLPNVSGTPCLCNQEMLEQRWQPEVPVTRLQTA